MRGAGLAVAVVAALSLAASSAHADRADQLFRKGKKLLAEKKYYDACNAFEESDKLDPAVGAKLNVALCYQEWGKLATAWRWYTEAEAKARETGDERAARIHTIAEELDATVQRLTLKAPAGADVTALAIKLDGVVLEAGALGVERRVDPGPHQVEYVVNGATLTKTIPMERGASFEVVLELPVQSRAQPDPGGSAPGPADPGQSRRRLGIGVAAGGGALIGIAGIVTLAARGSYKDALAEHCRGAPDMCSPEGLDETRSARRRANISTIITLGGLAAVGGGIALYFLAPRAAPVGGEHALYLAPSLAGDGGGVVFGGDF